ncbi:uncharacterized protein B0I36DRAFT_411085 [Microdochium trichocladiopsis]|uniref:Glycogen debranching enzyme n=1 Tax=Microdochium trichocladiopsis TaxID=1682393 RepID=A0A9P8Y6W8_9PEZI|nr:uncharacterized protein B0I36DRAFT_411085 [Microdochium trichocladiopsis]KAH7029256.1 hypothetical protein B0I36DRAFT_411085 [Microdochium trichocladiopsis]
MDEGAASSGKPELTSCSTEYLHLTEEPFENYFLSNCDTASQVVVTSPLPQTQSGLGNARLLVAWPAGDSGIVTYFRSAGLSGGSLSAKLLDLPGLNRTLESMVNGVSGILELDGSAQLGTTIIGSIRSLRDYIEGDGLLNDDVQKGLRFETLPGGGVLIKRQWLDGVTESFLSLRPTEGSDDAITMSMSGTEVQIPQGTYRFQAWQNYPFEQRLSESQVLNPQSQDLIQTKATQITALSFLSSKSKALAGAWRFLTYFGRDTLISFLLLQPVLSEGEGSITEAILGAALERINSTDGSVCHEEVIGDYATLLNLKDGKNSSEPQCDYKMVDTDYFLMVALEAYLVKSEVGKSRAQDFLATSATFLASNRGLTYNDLALTTVKKILDATAAFENSPTVENLIHLKDGVPVGEWRDSNAGLGAGRVPYDVNCALVPATLKAISSLTEQGLLGDQPTSANATMERAVFWEDNTLHLFRVNISLDGATELIKSYQGEKYYVGPTSTPDLNSSIAFHGLAIGGGADPNAVVSVMNTDDCFRLFFLNTTNDNQLSDFLQQTSDNILQPFPVGLSTPLGLVVANPAYTDNTTTQGNLTNGAYHGTVVWSWQLAMMAKGLEHQLARCSTETLAFCTNTQLRLRVEQAYSHLWDLIDANQARLDGEVWSWTYDQQAGGGYQFAALGTLSGPNWETAVESDIQQLWSLAFISVQRNPSVIRS